MSCDCGTVIKQSDHPYPIEHPVGTYVTDWDMNNFTPISKGKIIKVGNI